MANKNQVTVTFAGDSKSLDRVLKKLSNSTNQFESGITGSSQRVAAGFSNIGKKVATAAAATAAAATVAAAATGKWLLGTATDASDMAEALSKSNSVFGAAASSIESFADSAAKNLGISKTAALDAAGSFGNMFDQLGIGSAQSAAMSKEIIGLAADFGSFHNADISDVIDAQSAAFRGEYDALQRFLPLINAAAVEQKAMEMTGKSSTKALTQQDKALAVHRLMLDGAGQAQGDFARTADGMANAGRTAEARWADMRAEIGQRMIPVAQKITELKIALATAVMAKLIPAMSRAQTWFENNRATFEQIATTVQTKVIPAIKQFALWLGDRAKAAVGWLVENKDTWIAIGSAIMSVAVPAFIAVGKAINFLATNKDALLSVGIGIAAVLVPSFIAWAASAAAAAVSTLLAIAPILLIGAAVAALAYLIIHNWDWIKEKTAAVWNWIKSTSSTVWNGIKAVISAVMSAVTSTISTKVNQVQAVFNALRSVVSAIFGAISTVIRTDLNFIVSVFSWFRSTTANIFSAIGRAITAPISAALSGIRRAWNSTIGGKGINIPSVFGFGGASFTIPRLADGGIVMPRAGGHLVNVAEAGQPEAIVPLDRMGDFGSGDREVQINVSSGGSDLDRVLLEILRRAISIRGGDVQAVLG